MYISNRKVYTKSLYLIEKYIREVNMKCLDLIEKSIQNIYI